MEEEVSDNDLRQYERLLPFLEWASHYGMKAFTPLHVVAILLMVGGFWHPESSQNRGTPLGILYLSLFVLTILLGLPLIGSGLLWLLSPAVRRVTAARLRSPQTIQSAPTETMQSVTHKPIYKDEIQPTQSINGQR